MTKEKHEIRFVIFDFLLIFFVEEFLEILINRFGFFFVNDPIDEYSKICWRS